MSENELTQSLDTKFGYTQTPSYDPVNSPAHYNRKGVEAIQAIEASMSPEEYRGYLKGNCMKYLWRYQYKGKPVEDLKKCQWYLDRLIASHEQL